MIVSIKASQIVFHLGIQGLCALPYHRHPYGCPNFRRRPDCPPGLPLIDEVLDINKDIFAVYTPFPVGEFAERMRREHPQWASHPREWYNPRRWQPTARKAHRAEERRASELYGLDCIVGSPEAHGVDVTSTMRNIGVELMWNWPPAHDIDSASYTQNRVYLVSLAGSAMSKRC